MKSAWVGVLCIIELKNAGWNVEIQNPSLHNGSQKPHPDPKSTASSVQCESDVDLFFYCEFLSCGQLVNKEYYLKVKKRLGKAVRRKRPDLWSGKNWLFHHDKAPAHSSVLIRDFLTQHETTLVPQRPYSSDVAPADLFLFTKLKSVLNRRRFESFEKIKEN